MNEINKDAKTYMGKNINYVNGYQSICYNNKSTMVHRLIWEHYHNEKIPKGYLIHHIDGNKTNNIIDNLQLISKSEHRKLHMLGDNNPNFKYLYTMFDKNNNLVGIKEPLNYYMDNIGWNINSVVANYRVKNGRINIKGGKHKGSVVIIHRVSL